MNDLEAFATPRQREFLAAITEHGSARAAEKALGLGNDVVSRSIRALKAKAALKGFAPESDMTRPVAEGFAVKKVSTYYNRDGEKAGQWVQSIPEREAAHEAMRAAIEGICEGLKGLVPITPMPAYADNDILAVYPMGDPHFGLYSYAEETGDNFDLDIAEQVTCEAIDRLVTSAPKAATAMLLNLGDFFHSDTSSNQTLTSGNPLDVDTRFSKVIRVGLKAMVHCVRRLLEKHDRVIVWNMKGNHDEHSADWLSVCIEAAFSNDPRVEVDQRPSLYKFHRFGKVLLGAHHGHGAKANDLPLLMAADRPEDWGASNFRHWMCGHIHHWTAKEHPGVVVETFRTLAGKDAWHAGKGYRSGRDMNCIVFHKDHGEIQRIKCDISMLRAAA